MNFFNCGLTFEEIEGHLVAYGEKIGKTGGIDLLLTSASGGGRVAFVEPSASATKDLVVRIRLLSHAVITTATTPGSR